MRKQRRSCARRPESQNKSIAIASSRQHQTNIYKGNDLFVCFHTDIALGKRSSLAGLQAVHLHGGLLTGGLATAIRFGFEDCANEPAAQRFWNLDVGGWPMALTATSSWLQLLLTLDKRDRNIYVHVEANSNQKQITWKK
jgi:hypothetical protein